jgi:hypothetical protein
MKTYREAFSKAGFAVKFMPIQVSEEGLKKFGEEFWEDMRQRPSTLVFEATETGSNLRKG